MTENKAYQISKAASKSLPHGEDPLCYVESCGSRHSSCYSLGNRVHAEQVWIGLFEQGDYEIDERDRITMCTMLGTSRQIYQEAYRLFWMSNTFSFDDPYTFREFVRSLTLSQKRHITNIHVINRMVDGRGSPWGFCESAFKLLAGLKTFHLCLEQRSPNSPDYSKLSQRDGWALESLSQPWLALRLASLTNVTVVISDKQSFLQTNNIMSFRNTVSEKKWVAEKIRADIIDEKAVAKARQQLQAGRASLNMRRTELKLKKARQMKAQAARRMLQSGQYCITDLDLEQANAVSTVSAYERL